MTAARYLLGIAYALALAQSPRAAELRCAEWYRLGVEQQDARLRERIDAIVRSPEVRSFRIDRDALERCIGAQAPQIRDDFDDACAEGLEADPETLEWIFRGFAATCMS